MCLLIPVAPAESCDFAAAHAGGGSYVQGGVEAEMSGFGQEFGELLGGPAFRPGPFAAAGPWRLGGVGDVGRHEVVALCGAESGADDDVDVVDGLRCQPDGMFAAGGEEVGVEAVEVLGPQ